MPTTVTAQRGDTLCTIAINAGFNDCTPLRAINDNSAYKNRALVSGDVVSVPDLTPSDTARPTDAVSRYQIDVRKVGIRFVHGSANLAAADDLELNELNVSNFHTQICGIPERPLLPNDTEPQFDANADKDSDAFKVEVLDTRPPGAPLEVIVEPLVPTYDSEGNLVGHSDFPGDPKDRGTDRGLRALIGNAYLAEGKRYRTGYLRLVVDQHDQEALAKQTVLVTDNVSGGDSQTEILDQDIRATYFLKDCPASDQAKCRVETVAPLDRGSFVDLALHVLRKTPTGVVETTPGGPGDDGVVKLTDILGRVNKYCRRIWAQDQVKFRTVLARTVDLPSNMLTISDATGNAAVGHRPNSTVQGQVAFRVSVQRFGAAPDTNHDVAPILINAGATPEATANDIATAISAIDGLTATVSVNPAEVRQASGSSQLGSADILITDAQNGRITLTNLSGADQQDQDQIVSVCNLSLDFSVCNSLGDYHVGSQHERNLFKMLDTGDDRLDIFIVDKFANQPELLGFTLIPATDLDTNFQPMPGMKNSIVMRKDASDGTDGNFTALPHEIGHALLDCALHASTQKNRIYKYQLMAPSSDQRDDVHDSKRLIAVDPPEDNWKIEVSKPGKLVCTQPFRMNTVSRINAKSSGLLHE